MKKNDGLKEKNNNKAKEKNTEFMVKRTEMLDGERVSPEEQDPPLSRRGRRGDLRGEEAPQGKEGDRRRNPQHHSFFFSVFFFSFCFSNDFSSFLCPFFSSPFLFLFSISLFLFLLLYYFFF